MIIPWLALIICVLGALLYALSTNGKVQEMGRISFAFRLLVFLLQFGGRLPVH